MDALVKQLAIRLAESTVVLEVAANILTLEKYPKCGKVLKEHIQANTKLLDEIKSALKE